MFSLDVLNKLKDFCKSKLSTSKEVRSLNDLLEHDFDIQTLNAYLHNVRKQLSIFSLNYYLVLYAELKTSTWSIYNFFQSAIRKFQIFFTDTNNEDATIKILSKVLNDSLIQVENSTQEGGFWSANQQTTCDYKIILETHNIKSQEQCRALRRELINQAVTNLTQNQSITYLAQKNLTTRQLWLYRLAYQQDLNIAITKAINELKNSLPDFKSNTWIELKRLIHEGQFCQIANPDINWQPIKHIFALKRHGSSNASQKWLNTINMLNKLIYNIKGVDTYTTQIFVKIKTAYHAHVLANILLREFPLTSDNTHLTGKDCQGLGEIISTDTLTKINNFLPRTLFSETVLQKPEKDIDTDTLDVTNHAIIRTEDHTLHCVLSEQIWELIDTFKLLYRKKQCVNLHQENQQLRTQLDKLLENKEPKSDAPAQEPKITRSTKNSEHLDALGITKDEITLNNMRKIYYKLARNTHPDKSAEQQEKFQKYSAAYTALYNEAMTTNSQELLDTDLSEVTRYDIVDMHYTLQLIHQEFLRDKINFYNKLSRLIKFTVDQKINPIPREVSACRHRFHFYDDMALMKHKTKTANKLSTKELQKESFATSPF